MNSEIPSNCDLPETGPHVWENLAHFFKKNEGGLEEAMYWEPMFAQAKRREPESSPLIDAARHALYEALKPETSPLN